MAQPPQVRTCSASAFPNMPPGFCLAAHVTSCFHFKLLLPSPLQVEFTLRSPGAPWVGERRYSSLTAAAQEVADSRLWAGVHFPSSNADGFALGRSVAKQALAQLKGSRTAPALTLTLGH
jgi:hypothetical protein